MIATLVFAALMAGLVAVLYVANVGIEKLVHVFVPPTPQTIPGEFPS